MIKFFTCLAVLALIQACNPAEAPLSEKEKQHISGEVQNMLMNYQKDIKNKGLTAEFNYLDSSADFFWIPPGYTRALPFDSVAAAIRENASRYQKVENNWEELRIFPAGRELAAYHGILRSVITDTEGKVLSFRLIESGILIKRTSGWKLLSGHTSTLP